MGVTAAKFVYLSSLFAAPVLSTCYFPDGSVAQDTPCTSATNESACCGTGYACFGITSIFFLCESTGNEIQKAGASQYVRGSCTDQSWRSANCPAVCVQSGRDDVDGGNGVAPCPNSPDLFYCISSGLGEDNCTTGYNLIDFGAEPSILTTVGVVPSSTTSPAPSTMASSSSSDISFSSTSAGFPPASTNSSVPGTASAAASSSTSSSTGKNVGLAAGLPVGILGLVIAGGIAWLLFRRKPRSRPSGFDDTTAQPSWDKAKPHQSTVYEIHGSQPPVVHELPER